MNINDLQTEKPILTFEVWKDELIKVCAQQTNTPIAEIKINDDAAREWYNDGFSPYATFRETFSAY